MDFVKTIVIIGSLRVEGCFFAARLGENQSDPSSQLPVLQRACRQTHLSKTCDVVVPWLVCGIWRSPGMCRPNRP
jgi:hypothetical protein